MAYRRPCRGERSACSGSGSSSGSSSSSSSPTTLSKVASELEARKTYPALHDEPFPPACRSLLLALPGNTHCADCQSPRPEWANISYGVLLCVQCSGRHRSYGVQNSRVRSIDMDAWTPAQILAMLEGGNHQLAGFFERHKMHSAKMIGKRYLTKAALFYRSHLRKHIGAVATAGVYEGREAARRQSPSSVSSSNSSKSTSSSEESLQQQQPPSSSCLLTSPMQQHQGIMA